MTKHGMIVTTALFNGEKYKDSDCFIDIKIGENFVVVKVSAMDQRFKPLDDRKEFSYEIEEPKPKVLYVIYSHKKIYIDDNNWYYQPIIHGIFDEYSVSMQFSARRKVHADCMLVPLNKFVEQGVEL
ncbi:MAG: hypothetical protein EHM34_00245 [Nitrosopumilales archaeon]|nr:MAG: hypothetical protein EHM34_00245 [Nitrosopumilales archaeon]